jgi:hypothetical protein
VLTFYGWLDKDQWDKVEYQEFLCMGEYVDNHTKVEGNINLRTGLFLFGSE